MCPVHTANGTLINNSVLYTPLRLPLAMSLASIGWRTSKTSGGGKRRELVCSLRWQCAVQGKLTHRVLWELIIDVVVARNHHRPTHPPTLLPRDGGRPQPYASPTIHTHTALHIHIFHHLAKIQATNRRSTLVILSVL